MKRIKKTGEIIIADKLYCVYEVGFFKKTYYYHPDGTLQRDGRFADSDIHCAIVHARILEETDRRVQERKMAILVAEKIFSKKC